MLSPFINRRAWAVLIAGAVLGCAAPTSGTSLVAKSPSPAPTGQAARVDDFAPGAKAAAEGIRAEALAGHIRFLADDLLEGRAPGSLGHAVAARYVATQLQGLGLRPAGDAGTYFQKVDLAAAHLTRGTIGVTGGKGPAARLAVNKDFTSFPDFDRARVDVEADMIFAGHCLSAPEYRYDDFAAIDVKGKIAVCLFGPPHSDRPDFFPALPAAVHSDRERVDRDLRRRGAVGLLWVWTPVYDRTFGFPLLVQNVAFEQMTLAAEPRALPTGFLAGPAFDRVLQQAGRSETLASLLEASSKGTPQTFPIGLRAQIHLESKLRKLSSENVLGYVEADAASPHRNEHVLYGAHLDHLGVGEPVEGDRIYNGASDDAAGVASLLETARAFTRLARPPARKILFLFVTAEERGLLGSLWFASHPTVPLDAIVADVDVDGAYPIAPLKDVVAIGTDESTLGADVERAATALGLKVSPDPDPDQAYFIRSDNYSFVKRGIPAAQTLHGKRFLTGDERAADDAFWSKRYHQPQDEYEPARDFTPFADLTRFNFLLGLSVAQRDARPQWNPTSWFRRFPEKEAN